MTRWGIKTVDDRGRRVPLLKANRAAFFPTDELRAIAPEARSAIAASQRVPGLALVGAGWLLLMYLAIPPAHGGWSSGTTLFGTPLGAALVLVAYLLAMWTVAWFGGKLNRMYRHRALADTILRTGHCASCGYGMRFSPPHPDGCAVCPECGAAWRSERLIPAADPVAKIGPELWEQE